MKKNDDIKKEEKTNIVETPINNEDNNRNKNQIETPINKDNVDDLVFELRNDLLTHSSSVKGSSCLIKGFIISIICFMQL